MYLVDFRCQPPQETRRARGAGAKAPQRQDFALVRLDQEHALLAAPDAIEVRPLAKIDAVER
jgi:hypothetical protein